MALDALDKIYIDQAMERNRIQFRNEIEPFFQDLQKQNQEHLERILAESRKESEHVIGALKEAFKDDVAKIIEIASSRPDRDEVREIVREEVRPIRQEMSIFREEIMALRKDVNRHEKDFKRLKLKAA